MFIFARMLRMQEISYTAEKMYKRIDISYKVKEMHLVNKQ
jgi:hypothetical protein